MLSDPQEIGIAALLFTAFSFSPLMIAAANKYAAHKAKSSFQREFASESAYSLRCFTFIGLFAYGLLAAAITVYFWTANPATSSVPATLYLWTVGGYIFFIACKAMLMVHVVYGVEKKTGCLKAWLAFGAAIFLLISAAHSTANWTGDRFADIVFVLAVFAVNTAWTALVLWRTHVHAHGYARMCRAAASNAVYMSRRQSEVLVQRDEKSCTSSRD